MVRRLEVFGAVFIFRRIAAAHVSANQAKPQVHPCVAHLHAFFADVGLCGSDLDLVQVFAVHVFDLPSFLWFAPILLSGGWVHFQCVAIPTSKRCADLVGALEKLGQHSFR